MPTKDAIAPIRWPLGHYDATPELRAAVDAVLDAINAAKYLRASLIDLSHQIEHTRQVYAGLSETAKSKRRKSADSTAATLIAAAELRARRSVADWVALRDAVRKA